MDGGSTAKKRILMEDGNDGTMLSINACTNRTYRDISDLVVINPLDVYAADGFTNQPNVSASNATITTTIYER